MRDSVILSKRLLRQVIDFNGQVALVTGGSRGIGLAIAKTLSEGGCAVCITGRDRAVLDAACADVGNSGGRVLGISGNTADANHRASAVQRVVDEFGSIDVLVNNTGISPAYEPLVGVELKAVQKTLDSNVIAALGWVQNVYQASMVEHGGAIVNVASVAALRPALNIGAYAISKAALIAATRQLAMELGPKIRVNAVAPAVVRTRFARALYEQDEERVAARYPLGRLGEPYDVAAAVAFLASSDAAWITGETMLVDGGLMQTGGV